MPRPPVTPGGRNYHPLTISPALPAGRPASALATFLHEQLHWLDCPGIDAATTEASERWPDPPAPPAGASDGDVAGTPLLFLPQQSASHVVRSGQRPGPP